MRTFRVVVNGSEYNVEIEELGGAAPSNQAKPAPAPSKPVPSAAPAAAKPASPKPANDQAAAAGSVRAPMPGTVLQVGVSKGDQVTKGQMLLVLEAMKMENEILAPGDGVVEDVLVTQGISVNAGDVLIVLS